jgi:hypothetical protein
MCYLTRPLSWMVVTILDQMILDHLFTLQNSATSRVTIVYRALLYGGNNSVKSLLALKKIDKNMRKLLQRPSKLSCVLRRSFTKFKNFQFYPSKF